ncbi:MAG: hypothetical protein OXE99_02765 [Cellvibrionales bacterium]|nr:hypothetical protein [Cellvibrionales bacterium]
MLARLALIISLLFIENALSADGVLDRVKITEVRIYESATQPDELKIRLSVDGNAFVGDNPDVQDENGDPIPCKLFSYTESVMLLALKAKSNDLYVDIRYVVEGTDDAHCKVRYLALHAE